MIITIDPDELADELASYMMDEKYAGDPWMEGVPGKPDTYIIKEGQPREDYDAFYDEIYTLIKSCEAS